MWLEVPYWIDRVWYSKGCVCCACDPSVCLDAPSICFFVCFCMTEVISTFKSLRAGSHVLFGEYVCCSVVFGTLVGVFLFNVMWSDLVMTSAISCPLWSSSVRVP